MHLEANIMILDSTFVEVKHLCWLTCSHSWL